MSRDTAARPKRQRAKFTPTKPYSVERLEQALRVFGKFKARFTRRGLQYSNLGTYLGSSYNLRVRQSRGVDAMDLEIQDDDENDANYRPRKESSRKKKNKQVAQRSSSTSPERRIVKFSFSSIRAKMLLHKLLHAAAFADLGDDDDITGQAPMGHMGDNNESKKGACMQEQPSSGGVRNIRTAFSHPIDCELGNNCGVPCQFCKDFTFGMFGLGSRQVEVIDHGSFFEEIEGGHREEGQEQTRICNICALERLHVLNCAGHEISSIANLNPRRFDYQKAFNRLHERKKGRGTRPQLNPWCSFCINPAFFQCSTIQIVDIFADDIDPSSPDAQGCGLLLCESCKELMIAHHNDVGRVVAAIPQTEGLRADAGFLVAGSDLNRYFNE
ncbi:hypothetical protein UA08_09344 [Talaromyces atroroseus]|uniref:Uncharacterized protein n=1 Tax=Talaromyces atroroseus TaxID=1441469 RepID=A0A1Q5Q698_TALAT|nr:hypothetical protein UA08_09344 [Talaromyces atroroseus]OKL55389.1 hypothetical protein UA08_09344 [Talaromyces atroroseus]